MKTITFDTETTGLPDKSRPPLTDDSWPYPIQLAFITTDENFAQTREYTTIIRPPDGVFIHPKAEAVHGISIERARDEGIPLLDAIEEFATACHALDKDSFHCGYNLPFDDEILVSAVMRHAKTLDTEEKARSALYGQTSPVCVMKLATGLLRVPQANNGWRNLKLTQAYRRIMGETMANAHDAMGDVRATLTLFQKMLTLAE